MITRRILLEGTGTTLVASSFGLPPLFAKAAGLELSPNLPDGTRAEAVLESLPEKKPLIKLSYRPPNYETPIEYFRTGITANDVFFVRYHLSEIPQIDGAKWRLMVGGEGANGEMELTLDDLKKMPESEVVAVNQCSGSWTTDRELGAPPTRCKNSRTIY
jgi:DMSO/TMAO reductase YedYZ molybdopterin-dependent catalytic subunit